MLPSYKESWRKPKVLFQLASWKGRFFSKRRMLRDTANYLGSRINKSHRLEHQLKRFGIGTFRTIVGLPARFG